MIKSILKFKLLIIAFIMMICIINPIISLGADNLAEFLQASIDKTEVNMGDVVKVKLSNVSTDQIEGIDGVRYLSAKINYNKDVFEIDEDGIEELPLYWLSGEDAEKYGWKLQEFSLETGNIKFAFIYPLEGKLLGNADIAEITLKVKDNIDTTKEKITFTNVEIGTEAYNELKVADISLDIQINGNTVEDGNQEENVISEENNISNNNIINNNIINNNVIEKNDTTVANKELPKAGNAFWVIIIITCVAVIMFLIINYKKYQKYKKI